MMAPTTGNVLEANAATLVNDVHILITRQESRTLNAARGMPG